MTGHAPQYNIFLSAPDPAVSGGAYPGGAYPQAQTWAAAPVAAPTELASDAPPAGRRPSPVPGDANKENEDAGKAEDAEKEGGAAFHSTYCTRTHNI